MVHRPSSLVPAALGLSFLLLSSPAGAYNILALEMGGYWNDPFDQYFGASAGYGVPHRAGERWYTLVTPGALAAVDLTDYDVFLVQSAFTDDYVLDAAADALAALSAKQADIQQYVSQGGGLVAWSQPLPDGQTHPWDWAPVALETAGVHHENEVDILVDGHPIVDGSTDASLSGWISSWHGWFTVFDPRLQVIVQTGDYGDDPRTHRPLTLAGAYSEQGCGRMVFSMQDPDYHAYHQAPHSDDAATFIAASLDWAAQPCQPIPEPLSLTLLAAGVGGLGLRRWAGRGGRGRSATA